MRQSLLAALILVASALFITAQTTPPSIFLFWSAQGGKAAEGAASGLENQLYTDLFDKYRCMDMIDKSNVEALAQYQRMTDLLGGEANDQLLSQLAGAIGARYLINVAVTQLPNGNLYVRVVVIDSTTAKPVAMRDSPPVSEAGVNAIMDALRAQILADMASRLDGKCNEHWTGSISYNYKYSESGPKPTNNIFSGGDAANVKSTWEQTVTATDDMYVMLRPMSLGMNGALQPKAQVTRQFAYHFDSKYRSTMQVRCRPRGANSYLRPATETHDEKMDETGETKATRTVRIYVYDSGKYEIRLDSPVDIKTTWTRDDTQQRPGGCEDPPPVKAVSKGEDSVFAGSYKRAGGDIEGQVDPNNPNVLAGKVTSGNAGTGIQTITWNLRRVKPKARGEK